MAPEESGASKPEATPPRKGSQMTPEEKAAAIEAAKAKAAAAKAAREAAAAKEKEAQAGSAAAGQPATGGGAPVPAAAGAAGGEPAQAGAAGTDKRGAAPTEAPATPAAPEAKPAAAAKPPAPKKEAVDPATEIRPGMPVAGGLYLKRGEKPSKEEIIAKALEKIRATEKVIAERGGPSAELTRRQMFKRVGWLGFGGFMAFLGGCFGRFFFPRVLFEPPAKFKAGYPHEYTVGEVSTKYKDTNRTWIVREATGFYAIFARCTHLGCTPMWLEGEAKFKCPCHGSGYTKEGINYEGPAPRPMERCYIAIAEDGQILVDTGIRFRYEAGEWDRPNAYLRMG